MENDDIDFSEAVKHIDEDCDEVLYDPERFIKLDDFLKIGDDNYYKY